jgi:hypothetical protein
MVEKRQGRDAMKIESSVVAMQSQRVAIQKYEVQQKLTTWGGGRRPAGGAGAAPARLALPPPPPPPPEVAPAKTGDVQDQENIDPVILMMRILLESMFGRKINLLSLKDLGQDVKPLDLPDANQAQSQVQPSAPVQAQAQAQTGPAREPAGFEFVRRESYQESEVTQFASAGVVRTADGKEIAFNINLEMRRSFATENVTRVTGGQPRSKDPLVINFGGTAAQLTDAKFSFDLDSDGQKEQMPQLAAGSGYLAFDRNGDGEINNGKELFGTVSGDGFSELKPYDQDGNGWIDENDAIFDQLSIWKPAEDGKDALTSLGKSGVGAIFLGRVGTQFDLKTADNVKQGDIKSTGVVLMEDGTANAIQQMDVVV